MQYQLIAPGPFVMLKVRLDYGESLKAESGAMVAMSDTVEVHGKAEGGIWKGIKRMLAGESFFFQTLTASRGPGEVLLAHAIPGDIQPLPLDGRQDYLLQKDGFFAASGDVEIDTKVQSLWKGLFSGEGFFILRASGTGTLFVSSYGAIHALDLAEDQEMIIDNGHLVAWPANMDYKIEKASSGWVSSITSGEGLVCRFRGPGRVLIQTRNPTGFAAWLMQFLPRK
jgi:uncharacterized protein (TIGR00266 family)